MKTLLTTEACTEMGLIGHYQFDWSTLVWFQTQAGHSNAVRKENKMFWYISKLISSKGIHDSQSFQVAHSTITNLVKN